MALSRRLFLASAGAGAAGLSAGAAEGALAASGPMPLIYTYVAGSDRYAAPALADQLQTGTMLDLKREPENRYDSRAVSVWTTEGQKLGYVPRIHNQALANLMDAGVTPQAEVSQIKGPHARPDIAVSVAVAMPL